MKSDLVTTHAFETRRFGPKNNDDDDACGFNCNNRPMTVPVQSVRVAMLMNDVQL